MRRVACTLFILMLFVVAGPVVATDLPAGYAPLTETQPILDKTLHVELAPDVSSLDANERATVDKLIEVGRIFQRVYEGMRHYQALEAHGKLVALDRKLGSPADTRNLLALYYASKGPIVRGLDNQRRPILPVDPATPGGAVYPWGVSKEEIDAFLAAHPAERESILGLRTAVRRTTNGALRADLAVLRKYAVLDALHPGLRDRLEATARHADAGGFYSVPYSIAYADDMIDASRLLMEASRAIESEDPDFADYLRHRSRDLLTDDYESGDAAWVCGRFKRLNAQIGSYETYDDELYGVKTYFSLCVLLLDQERSDALRAATRELQRLEDALPYDEGKEHKRVRADIPVGVYDVVADFAQSRGTNTATILPNDATAARKYGRTIMLRRNIMEDATLFEMQKGAFAVAVDEKFANDLTAQGNGDRTLWHEIGHYLGVDRTTDGRQLDIALEKAASVYEEMKADLVSLYLVPELQTMGYYDETAARSVYASGVRRVLLKSQPDRSQPYQTMELMQMNYFLEKGVLTYDAASGRLAIHYDRFHDAVTSMLQDVFAIQAAGGREKAETFISRYTTWKPDLHERIAQSMRDAETYRFAYVTYGILESQSE
jgi:hypothetical protein